MSRTVVDLDDKLVAKAKRLTHLTKKVDLVNHALAELVQSRERLRIFELQGKVKWEGNLDAMRSHRR
jgi:Arc/MetJ family transcription regulator